MIAQFTALGLLASSLTAQPLRLASYPQPRSTALPAEIRATGGSSVETSDGAIWLAAPGGVIRRVIRRDGETTNYFAGRRFLPADEVQSLTPSPANNGVDIRTSSGAARLEMVPMTLEQKAELFERRVQLRHNRHGMVADSRLAVAGDLSTSLMVSSDNDGLWTAIYGAAECFRFAATKSPEALALAKRSVEALLYLQEVTGRPGFPARSYIRLDEPKPADGFWHPAPGGGILWKADTSSDEIVGHFYLFSVAFDLLPDPALKKRIAAAAARIMDHILANGYNLVDVGGQPTRWGKWSPAYFASAEGKPDAPLNAVELLAFLRATRHFTGDAKYEAEYRKAAVGLGYAKIAAKYAEWMEEINYSDEELAMLSFYTLFRYERDPALLASYRDGLDQWWRNIQREDNPLWMLIYRYCNPAKKLDLRPAVRTLAEIPLDLVHWDVRNSHRPEVRLAEGKDRFNRREAVSLLPAFERPVMKWNGNPFAVDGGQGGQSEDDGGFYLLPYWMGRHFKAWREAKTALP